LIIGLRGLEPRFWAAAAISYAPLDGRAILGSSPALEAIDLARPCRIET
jgi:hypothetical protein